MKIKELKDLTIKEFETYQELLKEEDKDMFSILELFGYKVDDLDISELKDATSKVLSMKIVNRGIQRHYNINGRRFKAQLNMSRTSASQFIDFQSYLKNFKLEQVLSVFLIPMKKNWLGMWKEQKYNTNYDIFETQDFLYNNFTIGDAGELSNSFFLQSQGWLKVTKAYLVKKEMKMKLKLIRTQLKVN